ncbi:MAG: hypothetical protein ACTS3F_03120 [Phycisphaerales bacterium]
MFKHNGCAAALIGAATVAAGAGGIGTATASAAQIETREFFFAGVGSSYFAAIFAGDPIIGKEIVETRITLNVNITGGDAANFETDVTLPIIPFEGNQEFVFLTGDMLGWSGTDQFSYSVTTDMLNGVFRAGGYGGETPGQGFSGSILEGSVIEVDYIVPGPGTWAMAIPGGLLIARRRRMR